MVGSWIADAWQTQVLDAWPYSERALFVTGTWAALTVPSLAYNGFLALCYHYNWFMRYRIQVKTDGKGVQYAQWPEPALVRDCLIHTVLLNQCVTRWVGLYLLYPLFVRCGMPTAAADLPSLWTFLLQLLGCMLFCNAGFYWGHRLLHHRAIYKYVHKKHHKFRISIGIAAEYAHPVEEVLANALPTLGGCLLLKCHLLTIWVWLVIRILETVDAHSGYNFPWSPFAMLDFQGGADRHDFHHSHNIGNYCGAFFHIWDTLCGTDKAYLDYKAGKKVSESKDD